MFGKKRDNHQSDFEMFTIFDTKTSSYDVPIFAVTMLDLQRQVINLFKDPNARGSKYVQNPEDYQVFKTGSFDRKTGVMHITTLEHVFNMHDMKVLAGSPSNDLSSDKAPVGMHLT